MNDLPGVLNESFGLRNLWEARHNALYTQQSGRAQTTSTGEAMDSKVSQQGFQNLLSALLDQLAPSETAAALGASSDRYTTATLNMLTLLEQAIRQEATAANSLIAPSAPSGLPVSSPISQNVHPGHIAIDLAAPVGTPVQATMSGKVIYAGWNNEGYGNLVIVENGPYRTYYAHLSNIPVAVGQSIQAGNVLGLTGNTGNSTGPHLHYEVRLNGQQVDPSL